MTLILNELYVTNEQEQRYWICSADRRLTASGKFHSNRQKLFPIIYLNATISYFGLAVFTKGKEFYFADILKKFITENSGCKTLDDFAIRLQKHLNQIIPSSLLRSYPSGFHICGFNESGFPHFIHISNIGAMNGVQYSNYQSSYKLPYADFLERDAERCFGWDGKTNHLNNGGFIYRNGDISTHVEMSDLFDVLMKKVFSLPSFKVIENYESRADRTAYKFRFISSLYKKWSSQKVIGSPIDIYILIPKNILHKKNDRWQKLQH